MSMMAPDSEHEAVANGHGGVLGRTQGAYGYSNRESSKSDSGAAV
jgi:hypothetical protein